MAYVLIVSACFRFDIGKVVFCDVCRYYVDTYEDQHVVDVWKLMKSIFYMVNDEIDNR